MSSLQLEKASKGQKINLSKASEGAGTGLTQIHVGAGWDEIAGAGSFDADLSAAFIGADGKCSSAQNFLYYGSSINSQGNSASGDFAYHTGDNLTGEGEGDDEVIKVDLTKVPGDVTKIEFYVTIYKADSRNQNFGMVTNAFVRIANESTGSLEDMVRFDLDFDASTATAVKFGSLLRRGNEWYFSADNVPVEGGLSSITNKLGL